MPQRPAFCTKTKMANVSLQGVTCFIVNLSDYFILTHLFGGNEGA